MGAGAVARERPRRWTISAAGVKSTRPPSLRWRRRNRRPRCTGRTARRANTPAPRLAPDEQARAADPVHVALAPRGRSTHAVTGATGRHAATARSSAGATRTATSSAERELATPPHRPAAARDRGVRIGNETLHEPIDRAAGTRVSLLSRSTSPPFRRGCRRCCRRRTAFVRCSTIVVCGSARGLPRRCRRPTRCRRPRSHAGSQAAPPRATGAVLPGAHARCSSRSRSRGSVWAFPSRVSGLGSQGRSKSQCSGLDRESQGRPRPKTKDRRHIRPET